MDRSDSIISSFKHKKVLIVGDVMVDAYVFGKVDRISPEAPVPVINVEKKESRLGGAANVALNIMALGAVPLMCTVIGEDEEGKNLRYIFKESSLSTEGLVSSPNRKTTTKTRLIGNRHQLLRIDNEVTHDLDDVENIKLLDAYKKHLETADVVILEDYNKGVLNEKNIPILIKLANERGVPIAVDPKKKNFLAYKNVTLFKPNLKEIREGLNIEDNLKDPESLKRSVLQLNEILGNKYSMITLSEDGVMITDHQNFYNIPAHIRNISDVSGAGDTVISVAALCLALQLPLELVAGLSNLAGGLVCEEMGVVPVNLEKFRAEAKIEFSKI
ncbi:MAG: D-glycero-beta-D-manno-heptose-7-phosphate kinase [Bacteroidia bacterium]|nr:D-glycero-beta-D-manno-heptose-7-phosphate kinase [Bacteroidia bacterium]